MEPIDRLRGSVQRAVAITTILLVLFPTASGSGKIRILIAGNMDLINSLRAIFAGEPSLHCVFVPCRLGGVVTYDAAMKFIRLYFPRTFDEMKRYEVIMLTQPEYNLFTTKQDQWMYDAIRNGTGGINDGSVFSIQSVIHSAWANSLTQQAFPNDAPAVSAKGGGEAGGLVFRVIIDPEAPDPILTPFIPFGVEKVVCTAASRLVIAREGATTLAWQVGNFPVIGRVAYLVSWDYEKGRTMTSGDFMGNGWFGCPGSPTSNQYSPDILTNMIFHITRRKLIEDVAIFHRLKIGLAELSSRMLGLVSLKDFIDKFGANTQPVENEIRALQEMERRAIEQYLDQEFQACQETIHLGLARFQEAEQTAIRIKNSSLLWVYLVEWLVTCSTLSISGTVVWTLMIRRRLYKPVRVTRGI